MKRPHSKPRSHAHKASFSQSSGNGISDNNAEKNSEKKQLPPVKLSSIWGVHPRVYVPLLWFALALIIMLAFSARAIFSSRGEGILVTSVPSDAAVFIDGIYVGATPYRSVIAKGTHSVRVSREAFTPYEIPAIKTRNVIFLQRWKLRAKKIRAVLPLENAELFARGTIEEAAAWVMEAGVKRGYTAPDPLSNALAALQSLSRYYDGANETAAALDAAQNIILMQGLAYRNADASEYATRGKTALFDTFVEDAAQKTSPQGAQQEQPQNINVAARSYIAWRDAVAQGRAAESISLAPSQNMQAANAQNAQTAPGVQGLRDGAPSAFLLEGAEFLKVPARTLLYGTRVTENPPQGPRTFTETSRSLEILREAQTSSGASSGVSGAIQQTSAQSDLSVSVPSFYILSREVSQALYARFLRANSGNASASSEVPPYIDPEYAASYMADFNPQKFPDAPMRFISYYDAAAFAAWFDNFARRSGYRAVIPNEYQWRAAYEEYGADEPRIVGMDSSVGSAELQARYALSGYGARNFAGGVWEFTDTWYSPLARFAPFEGPKYGSEKIILGGAFNTAPEIVSVQNIMLTMSETRNASMPPGSLNAYTGFRIALVPAAHAR